MPGENATWVPKFALFGGYSGVIRRFSLVAHDYLDPKQHGVNRHYGFVIF